MDIINLSSEPIGKLHSWIPHGLEADRIVFLPDACPGKSPLPTGTAVLTRQPDWRRFAVSDCGCGMRLLSSSVRKGSVHLRPGQMSVIPSHLSGDVVTVRATSKVEQILSSMSHGTGRKMSRGDCKALADRFDFAALRKSILLPSMVEDASLRTEGPYAYRDLAECLALISGYVEEVERFAVVAYMGHL